MSNDRSNPGGLHGFAWGTWAIGIGVLAAPGLAGAQMPPQAVTAQTATHAASFVAPDRGLILTRELRRSLFDGKEVVVHRSYRVRFKPDGIGYRVEGEMMDVTVEVPPKLAALADVERKRSQEGLFPLYLDTSGRLQDIVPPSHPARQDPAAASQSPSGRALTISDEMIDGVHLDESARADIRHFTRDVLTGTSEDHWPADLFHPACGLRSDTSHFTTPGGGGGSITVFIDAGCDARGLMKSFERMVTTNSGGEKRMTRELWTLSNDVGGQSKDPVGR